MVSVELPIDAMLKTPEANVPLLLLIYCIIFMQQGGMERGWDKLEFTIPFNLST